jgi:hypothetical protein
MAYSGRVEESYKEEWNERTTEQLVVVYLSLQICRPQKGKGLRNRMNWIKVSH